MDDPQPNRSYRRALASAARKGIYPDEPAAPVRPSLVKRLGGKLMDLNMRFVPGRTMAQYFLINFVLGAAAGGVVVVPGAAVVYFLR